MKLKIGIVLLLVAFFATQAISDAPVKESEFTFARVQFNMKISGLLQREAPWHHDYPFSEDFILNILNEVTNVRTDRESYQIVQLDDEEIFEYPLLYFSEPGFMSLTDDERTNLREWFLRGGFAVFDDFRGSDLANLREQIQEVIPEREMVRLEASEEIFHSFYDIDSIEMQPPYYDERFRGGMPEFWGVKYDSGRLMLIADQNNDLGEFFEWVDRGEMPFQPAAKATRLAVNYLVYAMSH